MSVVDIRQEAYQAGAIAATRDERRRVAALLEEIVGAADAESQLLALIDKLQAAPAGAAPKGAASPPQSPTSSASQATGDLGDQVAAILQAERRSRQNVHGGSR